MGKQRRRQFMAASAIILTASSASWAQEEDVASGELEVEEIVVTGSRIRRPDLNAVSPIISIDSSDLEKRSFTNIADALNELPAFGAPAASHKAHKMGFLSARILSISLALEHNAR
ncbi:hypothetical protein JCM17844_28760 [Iodidimonas gelatinilytica]|uniref:TonB-dependent receptor n=2 Tax=Iodidimonas gelatinilytica TaxID=1236966 RepID=A0A5A7MWF7_9PROT|nr:hypothetical protein JCM17844_28760 [Iodidimonas gelatinilytica]GER01065.1 hypothetical protein JCM17845_16880 [Iodidimonas gelatinilytica]